MTDMIDKTLLKYATMGQKKYILAVNKLGSVAEAARVLKVSEGTITRGIFTARTKATREGYAPGHFTGGVAPGNVMGKVTIHRDGDGNIKNTWERQLPGEVEMMERMKAFALDLGEGVKGLAPITKAPKKEASDLLCVYPWGDPHFGMYAWWQDAGADFDLEIAERMTNAAVDRLVSSAPEGSVGVLLNLGDMFHADNQKNTTQSGHQLDVDGRWSKVQQVGLRSMVHCIRRMLEKHSKVIIRINQGNHDGHSAYGLSLMLSCWFHNEPRVEVSLSPAMVWYYQFGKVLIGSTHGDTLKGKDMGAVMAADKPVEWGGSLQRYWYVGHIHHKDVKEYPGVIVEYFRTLAARDAWHQGMGYRAGRDMCLIVHHREFGEIERHRCDVGMLNDPSMLKLAA